MTETVDIAVLDYSVGEMFLYSYTYNIDEPIGDNEDKVIDFLRANGHKASECSWMYARNIEIHDLRGEQEV